MKISQREMILGVVTMTTILGGLTWNIISKKMVTHKTKKTEIATLRQEIRVNENRIKMQDDWIADLDELQKDLRVFDTKQKSVSPELMKTIYNIADKHGLNITRNMPRDEKTTGDLYEMDINYTWQGELKAIVGFLAELQQQGVRYDVRSLNVQPIPKGNGMLKGNMLISCAFIRK